MENVSDWSITIKIIYILFLLQMRQQLVYPTTPCLICSLLLPSSCLKLPLCRTEKMAGGAAVRLVCRKECAQKSSPASWSVTLSLKLVPKAGPSLKSDLLITAPPNIADLFLAFLFSALHRAFRSHMFSFQAIVPLGSSTFTPAHLSPPLPRHWAHQPLYFPPARPATLRTQAALPTTLHTQPWDPPANLPPKVITQPNTSSQDINVTTTIFVLYNFKMKLSKQEKRTFWLFSFYLLFSWLSIWTGFDSDIFFANLGPIEKKKKPKVLSNQENFPSSFTKKW